VDVALIALAFAPLIGANIAARKWARKYHEDN
jgi:hypothetical protein